MAFLRYATDILPTACSRPGCGHGYIANHGVGTTGCNQAPALHCEFWTPPEEFDERIGQFEAWN